MTLSIIAFYCDVEILDHTNSHRPAWNMRKQQAEKVLKRKLNGAGMTINEQKIL